MRSVGLHFHVPAPRKPIPTFLPFRVPVRDAGEDIISHMVENTDTASGLDKIKTAEEATELFERMLSAHLVAKPGAGKVVQAVCPP